MKVRELYGKLVEACDLPDLAKLAHWLAQQITRDISQLRSGAALPALGDEAACRYCEARGLCRKGAWSDVATEVKAEVSAEVDA